MNLVSFEVSMIIMTVLILSVNSSLVATPRLRYLIKSFLTCVDIESPLVIISSYQSCKLLSSLLLISLRIFDAIWICMSMYFFLSVMIGSASIAEVRADAMASADVYALLRESFSSIHAFVALSTFGPASWKPLKALSLRI